MASSNPRSGRLRRFLWPESQPRRWIHGIGLFIVGGTFLVWISVMAYGFLFSGASSPFEQRLFSLGAASIVVVVTTLLTTLPYALGSLAVRTARHSHWVVAACCVVGLLSLSFRVYVYGVAGGGQAFVNMILHVVPFSTIVLAGWGVALWRAARSGEGRSPSILLATTVGTATLLGLGATLAIWLFRDSLLWFVIGGPLALASLGLGFWTTRRARQEEEIP